MAHGGSIYALGGRDGTQNHMNHRYTPATNTWAVLAPMPAGRTGLDPLDSQVDLPACSEVVLIGEALAGSEP